jgi:hypothetical protein
MSADHATPGADTPARDPHDIIPESFCEDWGADTIAEALRTAEEAPSSTDPATQPRCPHCLARRLRPKHPSKPRVPDDTPQRVCLTCERGVDEPLPSERDVREGVATDRQLARVREALGGDGQTGLDAGFGDE